LRLTAGRIDESQRKISEDTAADGAAFRIHGNRLGDLHRTVAVQSDHLIEGGDDFGRRRCRCGKQQEQG
jgi:hypothetical protein